MRSYIFTEHERRLVRDAVEGRISPADPVLRQVRWRMKGFKGLREDVRLYLELAARLAEAAAA